MKVKVEVDVNELLNDLFEDYNYTEEFAEIDLKDIVKDDIIRQVKSEVLTLIKEPIKDELVSRVKILVKDAYAKEIESSVHDFVKNDKIPGRYTNDPDLSVKEWIKSQFSSNINNNRLIDIVQENSKSITNEIKERYDLLFASQIITQLNDKDLLKEGVFKALMAGK